MSHQIRTIFFDLGDTLVRVRTVSPNGVSFDWVRGAKELLLALRRRGLRLGIISNTGPMTRSQLLQSLPSDFSFGFFEEALVLLSSEVNIEKPDARLFRLAINRAQNLPDPELNLRLDPHNCLFCGEALVECLAAQGVGMRAARVQLHPEPDIGSLATRLKKAELLDPG